MCEDSTCIFFIYFLILYNVNFAKRPKRGIYEEIPLFVKSHNGAPLCTGEKPQLALYVFFIPLTFSNYIRTHIGLRPYHMTMVP